MNYELIIIGGGPAGITAGIYAARKKLNTLIITSNFAGQATKAASVENWPGLEKISGADLMKNFKNHLKKFEIDIKEGEEVIKITKRKDEDFEVKTLKEEKYLAKTVLITSGRNPRPLKIPGEKEFVGRGVSYCSICDAPLFRGKNVAVIGGGNSAFDAAFDLAAYAKKVYILEATSKFSADEISQARLKALGTSERIINARVQRIEGRDMVERIIYQDAVSKTEKPPLEVQGVFVMIGQIPATDFVEGLVGFNEKKEIKIDHRTFATRTPGLFAAGDVTDIPYKQIVIAAGEGAKAALAVYEYIKQLK